MMVARVRKRLVYASNKSETAGNNRPGVVSVMSMCEIISPAFRPTLFHPKSHMIGIHQHHRYLQSGHLRQMWVCNLDIIKRHPCQTRYLETSTKLGVSRDADTPPYHKGAYQYVQRLHHTVCF